MLKIVRARFLLCLNLFLIGAGPLCAAPIFGANLIVNGDAEAGAGAGSIPGWTITEGFFTVFPYDASYPDWTPRSTDPGPVIRGNYFFGGGPPCPTVCNTSSAFQSIDVSAAETAIDGGYVSFDLSGYFGGWMDQDDNAVLKVNFLDAGSSDLGGVSIGAVTPSDRSYLTGLLSRSTSGFLPVGTRGILVTLQMTRVQDDGSNTYWNDGYADNLALVLNASPVSEPSSVALWSVGVIGIVMGVGVKRRRKQAA